ncbi:MAG: NAD(P)/FAD-dependent oxidoreductase [Planctomycetes bacterium]|nr:NAD(P)/FAD-dependent oxidoreductase [Planctomycetota bacterium]
MALTSATVYDVAIVGAGPAGSTCAYYLAGQGKHVLLLERKEFPRDKICGDAVCSRAQVHLRRMGVLQQILAEGKGRWAEVGGMVSPSRLTFIGNSAPHTDGSLVIAIKRKVLDEKIARAAQAAGANLVENYTVAGAEFSRKDGTWTIHGRGAHLPTYRARVLVSCDGASSALAQSLGIVKTPADAVCSRSYVKAGTCDFEADGVVFYPRDLLPGYCALFREAGDELNFACYIIPGGRCTSPDLQRMHHWLIQNDPDVKKALGPRAELDKMRGAGLRLGGIPRSYGDHLLIVGDAAGHIDPLTGEGIQYAMDAAELAAQTLVEAFAANNLRASFLKKYQARWQRSFGRDFTWARWMAKACGKFPVFLDACAAVTQRRGAGFLAEWGAVMTGAKPKTEFLRPAVTGPILWEAVRRSLFRDKPKPAMIT